LLPLSLDASDWLKAFPKHAMARKYGEDQRRAVRQVREGLMEEIETLYFKTFEQLNDLELGEGAITKLTQLLLYAKEAGIAPLREEIEALRGSNS